MPNSFFLLYFPSKTLAPIIKTINLYIIYFKIIWIFSSNTTMLTKIFQSLSCQLTRSEIIKYSPKWITRTLINIFMRQTIQNGMRFINNWTFKINTKFNYFKIFFRVFVKSYFVFGMLYFLLAFILDENTPKSKNDSSCIFVKYANVTL